MLVVFLFCLFVLSKKDQLTLNMNSCWKNQVGERTRVGFNEHVCRQEVRRQVLRVMCRRFGLY